MHRSLPSCRFRQGLWGICHNDGEFSMSVFKACFEHAPVNRPSADESFSGVPGHGEGHSGLADLARVAVLSHHALRYHRFLSATTYSSGEPAYIVVTPVTGGHSTIRNLWTRLVACSSASGKSAQNQPRTKSTKVK